MRKNYFKRMKKTSVALLLGVSVLGGSVATYAATVTDFDNVYLYLPIEEYVLSTARRNSYALDHASLMYAYSNCRDATIAFNIREESTGDVVSNTLYLSRYDSTQYEEINYLNTCMLRLGKMKLMGKTASSHTGYYVTGEWNPNGGLAMNN